MKFDNGGFNKIVWNFQFWLNCDSNNRHRTWWLRTFLHAPNVWIRNPKRVTPNQADRRTCNLTLKSYRFKPPKLRSLIPDKSNQLFMVKKVMYWRIKKPFRTIYTSYKKSFTSWGSGISNSKNDRIPVPYEHILIYSFRTKITQNILKFNDECVNFLR